MSGTDDFNPDVEFSLAVDDDEADNEILDLEDIDENAMLQPAPAGLYAGIVDEATYKKSSKGNPMLEVRIKANIPQLNNAERTFFYHITTNNDLGKARLKKFLKAVAPTINLKAISMKDIGPQLIGLPCMAKVAVENYQGSARNSTKDVLPGRDAQSAEFNLG